MNSDILYASKPLNQEDALELKLFMEKYELEEHEAAFLLAIRHGIITGDTATHDNLGRPIKIKPMREHRTSGNYPRAALLAKNGIQSRRDTNWVGHRDSTGNYQKSIGHWPSLLIQHASFVSEHHYTNA